REHKGKGRQRGGMVGAICPRKGNRRTSLCAASPYKIETVITKPSAMSVNHSAPNVNRLYKTGQISAQTGGMGKITPLTQPLWQEVHYYRAPLLTKCDHKSHNELTAQRNSAI